ncbi:inorganic polyphosphate kinase [Candidatus Francisella endociliophora]|uniref:NAD kinase n=2 Tax=Candidatus Francisella endociliophora TaxID=653937 RepID=A0A097ER29_9GAMM|nr:inorganic polyphosphate kinase [Francisella sp. FSC1006]
MFVYKKIAIIGKHYNIEVAETVTQIYKLLSKYTAEVYVEEESAQDLSIKNIKTKSFQEISQYCDMAIIVGGDGNFLKAARLLALYSDIHIVGVNKGKLGFLTTIKSDKRILKKSLLSILKGNNKLSNMSMIKCKIDDKTRYPLETSIALNEIAITSSRGLMFGLKVYIDGRYAFDQRGDGLIISTPTGSTAHAMSAGGPILCHNHNSIELVAICSHSLTSRPLVISDNSEIDIHITNYNDPEPVLSIDGRHDTILKAGQKISIKKAKKSVKVLHPEDYNYYDTLREKLGWGKVLF